MLASKPIWSFGWELVYISNQVLDGKNYSFKGIRYQSDEIKIC